MYIPTENELATRNLKHLVDNFETPLFMTVAGATVTRGYQVTDNNKAYVGIANSVGTPSWVQVA